MDLGDNIIGENHVRLNLLLLSLAKACLTVLGMLTNI